MYFGYHNHLKAEHMFVVGNIYCNTMNVRDEILSYIKMEGSWVVTYIKNGGWKILWIS